MPYLVDADTHVIESALTWEGMSSLGFENERPKLFHSEAAPKGGGVWVFDRQTNPGRFFSEFGDEDRSRTQPSSAGLIDVALRLSDMDRLGVAMQVIYATYALTFRTRKLPLLSALCRCYNEWMATACSKSDGRLRFAAVLPLIDIDSTLEELHRAKQLGAVAATMLGYEEDKLPTDEFFYPLYRDAAELDLAICIHAGNGNRYLDDNVFRGHGNYGRNKLPVLGAFNALYESDIPERFPGLRFGFIEATASWLPYMMIDLQRRIEMHTGKPHIFHGDFLTSRNFFVSCQVNDDLAYVVDRIGSDNVIIGSDYGHADTASDLEAVPTIAADSRLSPSDREKIVTSNPLALYGLSAPTNERD